jgi:hypothetical protein
MKTTNLVQYRKTMYSFYILLPDHKNLSVLRIGTLDVIVKTKPKEVKHT